MLAVLMQRSLIPVEKIKLCNIWENIWKSSITANSSLENHQITIGILGGVNRC